MDNQELKNLKYIFGVFAILFLTALVAFFGVETLNKLKYGKYIGREIETNRILVSGTGEIFAKPDLSIMNFSVVTEGKTVDKVMSENADKMNKVINIIKRQGVEDKDVKTISFNISPRYEWQRETTCLYPPCPAEKRVLVGYEMQQSLEVKIRDMTKIGEIIQGATDAGANLVGDLYFTFDKKDELESQARLEAIIKAKAKARELAEKLGVKLVRIINFSEGGIIPLPAPYYMEKMSAAETGGGAPQIETGQNKIAVTVSITYEIQ